MRWEPVAIARFARDGGFVGEDITVATAVALASSVGIANYELRAGTPGAGHWQGLWAVDTDRFPEYADRDLFVPQMCAETAHDLCRTFDGWAWSPVYATGRHRFHLTRAGSARTWETGGQLPGVPFTFHETERSLDRAYQRLMLLRTQLQPLGPRGANQWQIPTR